MASSKIFIIGTSYSSSAPECEPRRQASPQMFPEKLGGAAPGELRGMAVVHRHALLVDEGVLGVITKKFERLAGRLHGLLEAVDQLRRAPVILVGEMRL